MIAIISHDDGDGVGPVVIAKKIFGKDQVRYFCLGYENVDGTVMEWLSAHEHDDTPLYITDISVNSETAEHLNERYKQGKFIKLIDHHPTATWLEDKYEWASVSPLMSDGVTKTCATQLFCDYLREKGLIHEKENDVLNEYAELVRLFDTWDWVESPRGVTAKKLNDLLGMKGEKIFVSDILDRLARISPVLIDESDEKILKVEEERIKRYLLQKEEEMVKSTFMYEEKTYKVGNVFAEQYHSELGKHLYDNYEELDFIIIINMGKKRLSFRTSKEHVEVNIIAKAFGGGGHPKAAGCSLTKETFDLFVSNLTPIFLD